MKVVSTFVACLIFFTLGAPRTARAQDPVGVATGANVSPEDLAGSATTGLGDRVGEVGDTALPAAVREPIDAAERANIERAAGITGGSGASGATPISLPTGDAKSAVTPQAISLPNAEGSIEGMGESFAPVLSSGTATFSVPIALPAGRAGVQPSLALSYASSNGNGPTGIGWSLGVPFIARQTDRGLPKYQDAALWTPAEDRFFYNGGQELVPVDSDDIEAVDCAGYGDSCAPIPAEWRNWQQYRARVEGGFMRFFRSPNADTWIVQGKDGTTFEFGQVSSLPSDYESGAPEAKSIVFDEDAGRDVIRRVFRWNLVRTSDAHGSTVIYRYFADRGQTYLWEIFYVSPASCASANGGGGARECAAPLSDYARRVRLTYVSRDDADTTYIAGFPITTALRLDRIDVTARVHDVDTRTFVRRYQLGYDAASFHSLLTSVQVLGRPSAGGDVSVGDRTIAEARVDANTVTGFTTLPPMGFSYSAVASGSSTVAVPGFGRLSGARRSAGLFSPENSVDEARTDLFDVNSDGLPDVIVTDPATYRTEDDRPAVGVYFNGFPDPATPSTWAPGHFSRVPVTMPMPPGLSGVLALSNANIVPMDADGDGRSDLLHVPPGTDAYGYFTPVRGLDGETRPVAPSGQGWSFAYISRTHDATSPIDDRIDFTREGSRIRVFDVNNDHLVDVVRTTGTEVQTWLNLGWVDPRSSTSTAGRDDGDGRFGNATYAAGTGWTLSESPIRSCVLHEGLPIMFDDPEVRLADMNGDGLQDIVKLTATGTLSYWPGRGPGVWGTGPARCDGGSVGAGRSVRMTFVPPPLFDTSNVYLEDVNADGAADIVRVRFTDVDVWLNRAGTGFAPRATLSGTPPSPDYTRRIRFADIDGSGTQDIVFGTAGRYEWVDVLNGVKPRLLVGVENGLGAKTTISYDSASVDYFEDLRAAAADTTFPFHWSDAATECDEKVIAGTLALDGSCARASGSPVLSTVVRSISTTDRWDALGGVAQVSRSEFAYHDAYYEGVEQEYRGFAAADAQVVGDAFGPSMLTRTYFHQGRRPEALASSRLAQNPNEALKGREYLTEVFDGEGTAHRFLSSTGASMVVRRLLDGLNDVPITYAYVSQTDELRYDVIGWADGDGSYQVPIGATREHLGAAREDGFDTAAAPKSALVSRGAGFAHIRSTIDDVDNVGQVRAQTAHGRIRGEYGESEPLDAEAITTRATPVNVSGAASGWLWRTASTSLEGADGYVGPPIRNKYTSAGDLRISRQAIERPGVPAYVFGPGTDGSAAYALSDQESVSSSLFDPWGTAIASCAGGDISAGGGADGPCLREGAVSYDPDYALHPLEERVRVTSSTWLATHAEWDEGLGALLSATDPNEQTSTVVYDGLGRVTSMTAPPSASCGSAGPATRISYHLTENPATQPVSYVASVTELACPGGTSLASDNDRTEAYVYVDGLGRPRAALGPASDGGWIRGGLTVFGAKGQPVQAFHPVPYAGSPTSFAQVVALPEGTPSTRALQDAFGREIAGIAEDGSATWTHYHALSTDVCDPLDNDRSRSLMFRTCTTQRVDGHGRAIDQTIRNRKPETPGTTEYYRLWSYHRADGTLRALVRAQTEAGVLRPTHYDDGSIASAASGGRFVKREFFFDTAGRRLGATDPDTDSRSPARSAGDRTWRYLFNEVGDLVAVRDPRGCGQNFFYDFGGRLVGEDYVLCGEAQAPGELATEVVDDAVALAPVAGSAPVDVRYYFDAEPPWASDLLAGIPPSDASPPGSASTLSLGRPTGVADRGQRSLVAYDARGNAVWTGRQMAIIGDAAAIPETLAEDVPGVVDADAPPAASILYDPHSYVRTASFDHANRPFAMMLPSNPDYGDGDLRIGGRLRYDNRGLPTSAHVTFALGTGPVPTTWERTIVASTTYDPRGLATLVAYGDGGSGRAPTQSSMAYDARSRPIRMATDRTPTGVESLSRVRVVADQELEWDAASNLTRIFDHRDAADWPDGSKPQSITVTHDALYHVAGAEFDYATTNEDGTSSLAGGDDLSNDWRAAFAAVKSADPMRGEPAPLLPHAVPTRVRSLVWSHDWLGNTTEWDDDAGQFYERSIGDIRNGHGDSGEARPSALYFAANLGGPIEDRGGYLELAYGEGGDVEAMTVHGQCVDRGMSTCGAPETSPSDTNGGASSEARAAAAHATCECAVEQHYQYRWDELNRIAEARRFDRDGTVADGEWKLAARQRYRYDSANVRTVKQTLETITDVAGGADGIDDTDGDPPERLALYVYPGDLERRGLTRDPTRDSYIEAEGQVGEGKTGIAETQYVVGGARVVWEAVDAPTVLDGSVTKSARVTISIGDLIGTTGAVLDLESGALVEASTYYPNGARESFVRGGDGAGDPIVPEPKGFTGKEGDEEVGLTYFGERYLISRVGRWASADPLHVHAAGGGEVGNSFHYVSGNLLLTRDPVGLDVYTDPTTGVTAEDAVRWIESSEVVKGAPADLVRVTGETSFAIDCGSRACQSWLRDQTAEVQDTVHLLEEASRQDIWYVGAARRDVYRDAAGNERSFSGLYRIGGREELVVSPTAVNGDDEVMGATSTTPGTAEAWQSVNPEEGRVFPQNRNPDDPRDRVWVATEVRDHRAGDTPSATAHARATTTVESDLERGRTLTHELAVHAARIGMNERYVGHEGTGMREGPQGVRNLNAGRTIERTVNGMYSSPPSAPAIRSARPPRHGSTARRPRR